MIESKKFDPKKLEKLNDPERIKYLNPDLIWDAINSQSAEVIVDIGTGTGFFASLFSKKMRQGKVYACDNNQVMIDWMNKNLVNNPEVPIIPVKSEEDKIPLSDGIADIVFLINVYHELNNPERIINEAYRLLKDSGKLVVIDWKAEQAEIGPPVNHRVPEDKVIKQFENTAFLNIETHNKLTFHYFITACK